MKKRLNILCLLVLLTMSYSLVESAYWFGYGMKSSLNAALSAAEKKDFVEIEKLTNIRPVALVPDEFMLFSDSVLNAKTGKYVPAIYGQMLVSVKAKPSFGQLCLTTALGFLNLFATLAAVIFFVLLLVSINKSDIFDWRNVRRLRWLGGALILTYLCGIVPLYITNSLLSDVFSVKGYSLHLSEFVSITNLVLGLSALIVGEIFAIGLRMKEEQELTI